MFHWVGRKQCFLKYHRRDQNPAATYRLCPCMNDVSLLCTSVSPSLERSLSWVTHSLESRALSMPGFRRVFCWCVVLPDHQVKGGWNYE